MGLSTLIFTLSLIVLVYALTRAKKMNIALQIILCFIAPVYLFITPEIDSLLISWLVLTLVIATVNLSMILLFLRKLPKIEISFSNKPAQAYLLLLLAAILLIVYMTFILFIGLLGEDFKTLMLLMALTGGFTILLGIPTLFCRVILLGIKATLNTRHKSSS